MWSKDGRLLAVLMAMMLMVNAKTTISINEDIAIVKEIKNNPDLYRKLRLDPKRTIELINRKLNK